MPKSPETFQCSVCCPTTTTTTAAPTTTVRPTTTTNPNTTTVNPNTTTVNPNTTTVGPPEPSTTPPPVICACCSKGLCPCKEMDGVKSTFSLVTGFLIFVHRPYPIPAHEAVWSNTYGVYTAPDMVETDKGPYGNVMPDGRKRLLFAGTIDFSGWSTKSGNVYNMKYAGLYQGAFGVDDWNGSQDGTNTIESTTWIQVKETNNGINCSLYARPKRTFGGTLPVFDDVEWTKVYSTKKTNMQDGAIIVSLPSEWFCCGVTGVDLKINVCQQLLCYARPANEEQPVYKLEGNGQASWVTNPVAFTNEPKCVSHGNYNAKRIYTFIQGGIERDNYRYETGNLECVFVDHKNCVDSRLTYPYMITPLSFSSSQGTDLGIAICDCGAGNNQKISMSSDSRIDVFFNDFNAKDGKLVLDCTWRNTLEDSKVTLDLDEYYSYYVVTSRAFTINTPDHEYKKGTVTITRLV